MKRIVRTMLLAAGLMLFMLEAVLAMPKVPVDAKVVVAGIGYQGAGGGNVHTRECLAKVATECVSFYLNQDTKWNLEMLEDRKNVLSEQGINSVSDMNPTMALRIGQEQRADYVLYGNIVGMGVEMNNEGVAIVYDRETQKADAKISLCLINTKTGSIVTQAVANGSSTSNSGSALQALAMFLPGFTGYYFNNQSVPEELLHNAIDGGVESAVGEMLDKLAIKHPHIK